MITCLNSEVLHSYYRMRSPSRDLEENLVKRASTCFEPLVASTWIHKCWLHLKLVVTGPVNMCILSCIFKLYCGKISWGDQNIHSKVFTERQKSQTLTQASWMIKPEDEHHFTPTFTTKRQTKSGQQYEKADTVIRSSAKGKGSTGGTGTPLHAHAAEFIQKHPQRPIQKLTIHDQHGR